MNKYLISIVGPTAVGKSALAIKLAQHFATEIISADSRQFYKEMTIGTAIPSKKELAEIPHHFMQHKSIIELYSVGDFEKDALNKIGLLFKKYPVLIMVGGSGLYTDAILNGLDDFPKINPAIREQLHTILKNEGIKALQEQLQQADPKSYQQIDIHNPRRIMRALEVCIAAGKPYSSFLNKKKQKRNFIPICIGITAAREITYKRINNRVDKMIQQGLLKEAQQLYPYKNLNALQTVGYKELFRYFDSDCTLDFAISEIKKNTRRYAKRQLTWFKRDHSIVWFDYTTNIDIIIREIHNHIV